MRTLKLFLLLIFCVVSQSFVIQCKFYVHSVTNGYSCEVINTQIVGEEDLGVTNVTGQHLEGKDNDDVKTLYSDRQMKLFPRSLTEFFPNIQGLIIVGCNAKNISKTDLEEFGENLKVLALQRCGIEVIESDLFEFTPNITDLNISENEIVKIEANAIGRLKKLEHFRFGFNPCTSCIYMRSLEISDRVRRVEQKCGNNGHELKISIVSLLAMLVFTNIM